MAELQAHWQELPDARPGREGDRQGAVRRGLARRGHAVLPSCCSARVRTRASRGIDASAALAMPGVHAVLTADDMPAPPPPPAPPAAPPAPAAQGGARGGEQGAAAPSAGAPAAGATGNTVRARPRARRHPARRPGCCRRPAGRARCCRAQEPPQARAAAAAPPRRRFRPKWPSPRNRIYEGEPILAVAADSEETRRRRHRAHHRRVRAAAVRHRSDRLAAAGRPERPHRRQRVRRQRARDAEVDRRRHGAGRRRQVPDRTPRPPRRSCSATSRRASPKPTSCIERDHQPADDDPSAAREPDGDGLLAERQAATCTARRRAWRAPWPRSPGGSASSPRSWCSSASTPAAASAARFPGAHTHGDSGAALEEAQRPAGDDAHLARRRDLHRPHPPWLPGLGQDGLQEGRPRRRLRRLHRRSSRPVPAPGRSPATSANNASLMYQVPNMRFRGISVATNTPPGTSQRAPGGLQASVMFEPMIDEAARQARRRPDRRSARSTRRRARRSFGLVAGELRRRDGPATSSPAASSRSASTRAPRCSTGRSARRRAASGNGNKVTGVAVASGSYTAGSIGVDGLVRHQARRQAVHPPGHRQPRHPLGDRHRPRHRGAGRHAVGEVRSRLGRHQQGPGRGARCRPAARPPTRTPAPTTPRARR